jgi:8-oxo-dGTP diphosphatase
MSSANQLNVVIGIVIDSDNRVLIAERPNTTTFPGYWEFPGGKKHEEEGARQALTRELNEEVGIAPLSAEPFMQTCYSYNETEVILDVWWVTHYSGTPYGRENQLIWWYPSHELPIDKFPEGNRPVLERLHAINNHS